MREIKFRAWDITNGKIIYFEEKIFNKKPYTEASSFSQYESHPIYHELILMQSTGLKDKNGKEIYEGDIVKFGDNKIYENTHAKVEFSSRRAQYIYFFIDGKYKYECTDMYDEGRSYEVVGNIYENTELLKEIK